MPMTTGLVQQVKYNPYLYATFVWVGPSIQNTIVYYVLRSADEDQTVADMKTAMIDGLTAAMFSGKLVTISYTNAVIQTVQVQTS